MMQHLIEQLRECAEWAEANIWEVPVILPDLLKEAADKIEADKKEIERLKQDETVQPIVHGKWIETEQPMGWDNVSCATCSVCGEDFVLDEWGIDDVRREMHYCMNCGARMDLEDDT